MREFWGNYLDLRNSCNVKITYKVLFVGAYDAYRTPNLFDRTPNLFDGVIYFILK